MTSVSQQTEGRIITGHPACGSPFTIGRLAKEDISSLSSEGLLGQTLATMPSADPEAPSPLAAEAAAAERQPVAYLAESDWLG